MKLPIRFTRLLFLLLCVTTNCLAQFSEIVYTKKHDSSFCTESCFYSILTFPIILYQMTYLWS